MFLALWASLSTRSATCYTRKSNNNITAEFVDYKILQDRVEGGGGVRNGYNYNVHYQ